MSDIVDDEQRALERVRTLLEEEPYQVPPSEAEIVAELVRLREELPTAKDEDAAALLQQYDLHHAWLDQVRGARARPEVDPDSPYFAHLKLEEDGKSRDVFLGKATRIGRGVRIVDWRHAPVSRLFYAYQQGDEYEEELGDRVHTGEVVARRTVTIRRGQLLRVDAPEGSWVRGEEEGDWRRLERSSPTLAGGQGTALRAHEVGQAGARSLGTDGPVRADKHLPDIAGLIDPEQFELVTRPSSGFVVVRGTAGSGKTTVALHRIAWLAYQDPEVDSERTLFLVFSPALREYVSHVLPALGVNHARIRDFRDWAAEQRRRHFPQLPNKTREDTPAIVVRLKLHPAVHAILEEQVRRARPAAAEDEAPVEVVPGAGQVWDDVVSALTDVELMSRVLEAQDPGAFTTADLQRVATWVRDRANELVAKQEGDEEADPALDLEDDALLLHAWQLRVGPLRKKGGAPLRYRHVAIDEVQDFSPLEVRVVIGCLDERQSLTLAGDTQQHVMKEAGFTSWSAFLSQLGIEGSHVDTLRVAYRSTRPIVEFALKLLGDLLEDEAPLVTRDGPEVELFRFTDHGQAVAFLGDVLKDLERREPLASVVLLAPDVETAALYEQGLRAAEVPRLRRVVAHDFRFAPGVEVAPVASVKGLEFDYVVLLEPSARHYPDRPDSRRLLHVAATRAIHQLWLTCVETPSPILPPG